MGDTRWTRRKSWPVKIGRVTIGGDNPVAVQSMTTTSTLDTLGSAEQIARIARAGGEIVRLTTQGVREAENLTPIREALGVICGRKLGLMLESSG